jgi:hypothetical protein
MISAFHKNAATTPAIPRKIAQRDETVAVLAARYLVCEDTVRKWKTRDICEDRSHTAHRLQTTQPQVKAHRLGVARRQDQRRALPSFGQIATKEIG